MVKNTNRQLLNSRAGELSSELLLKTYSTPGNALARVKRVHKPVDLWE